MLGRRLVVRFPFPSTNTSATSASVGGGLFQSSHQNHNRTAAVAAVAAVAGTAVAAIFVTLAGHHATPVSVSSVIHSLPRPPPQLAATAAATAVAANATLTLRPLAPRGGAKRTGIRTVALQVAFERQTLKPVFSLDRL